MRGLSGSPIDGVDLGTGRSIWAIRRCRHGPVDCPISGTRGNYSPYDPGMSAVAALPRTLVVIPALNEEATVGVVIAETRLALPRADILVVDDGSTDDTAGVAEAAGASVCRLPFNLGVGGAMRLAFRYAQSRNYEVVVQVDADGQHDPRFLPRIVDGLQSADLVVGARFAGVGEYAVSPPRRAAMRWLAWTLSNIAGQELTDVTSGFRAFGPRAITVFADHYPQEYLGDTVEALVIAVRTGCSVRQVPVEMQQRIHGKPTQSTAKACAYLVRAVAALSFALMRRWPVPEKLQTALLDGPASEGLPAGAGQ